jgi:hypothetical protein
MPIVLCRPGGSIRRPLPTEAERWLSTFATDRLNHRRGALEPWFRLLAGREPTQELADEFRAELIAKFSTDWFANVRRTVNSYLRASAAESATPIMVHSHPIPPIPRWLRQFRNDHDCKERVCFSRAWFRFLAGREPTQELAYEFTDELIAKVRT